MEQDGAHPIAKNAVPGCTYSRPQIASIGLTEAAARADGLEIKVGKFNFMANGKAIAILVGPEVTEMIQGFAIALKLETTENELMETIFPHPTLSEAMHESVLDAYDRVIHQ